MFTRMRDNIVNEIDFCLALLNNADMYVCICNAISDKQVSASVANGATTLADLQAELGVATNCGCCAETAKEYLPGGRYAPVASAVDAEPPRVKHAANDPAPVFQEVVVQRA